MKRLTVKGFAWKGTSNFRNIGRWNLAECLNRLSEYEDTCLTPDEINALRERDTVKEIRGIVDHSCFAFCPSCMQKITVWAKFCPECGQRLKLATAAPRPEWKDRMLHTFLGGHT